MTNLHSDKIENTNLHTTTNHIYTNTKLRKLLVPIIIEQLLASLMGTVDTMMVSNVGSAAISAVSLVDSINILVIQALSALAAGGAILCSQYLGSHNTKGARHAARQVFFVMAFLSVLLSAFCLITRKSLLRAIFGAVEADVMRNSQVYFFFTLLSFPFIGLYDAGASIMRAQNNSRNPMVISVISNFMNIGGNAILIFGFGMGVEGAAISTLVSRIFCAIVVIIQLRRENEPIFIKNYMSIRPEWGLIKKILLIGIPSGIENSMFQFGKLAIQSTVSTLGTVAIAAQAIANQPVGAKASTLAAPRLAATSGNRKRERVGVTPPKRRHFRAAKFRPAGYRADGCRHAERGSGSLPVQWPRCAWAHGQDD